MKFSIIAIAAMAATVLAAPQSGGSGSYGGSGSGKGYGGIEQNHEQSQCGNGDMICCNNVHDEKGGLLDLKNVLKHGLITLWGLDDVGCANPKLLDSVNIAIFGDASSDDDIINCKQETYCCPYDDNSCYNMKNGKSYQKSSGYGQDY